MLVELGLRRQDLKKLRAPLERCGVIVTRMELREDAYETLLYRWDQLVDAPAGGPPDLAPLVLAAVRAAVVAPEREVPRWFSWRWRWESDLIDRLVEEGSLTRPQAEWLAAR